MVVGGPQIDLLTVVGPFQAVVDVAGAEGKIGQLPVVGQSEVGFVPGGLLAAPGVGVQVTPDIDGKALPAQGEGWLHHHADATEGVTAQDVLAEAVHRKFGVGFIIGGHGAGGDDSAAHQAQSDALKITFAFIFSALCGEVDFSGPAPLPRCVPERWLGGLTPHNPCQELRF